MPGLEQYSTTTLRIPQPPVFPETFDCERNYYPSSKESSPPNLCQVRPLEAFPYGQIASEFLADNARQIEGDHRVARRGAQSLQHLFLQYSSGSQIPKRSQTSPLHDHGVAFVLRDEFSGRTQCQFELTSA